MTCSHEIWLIPILRPFRPAGFSTQASKTTQAVTTGSPVVPARKILCIFTAEQLQWRRQLLPATTSRSHSAMLGTPSLTNPVFPTNYPAVLTCPGAEQHQITLGMTTLPTAAKAGTAPPCPSSSFPANSSQEIRGRQPEAAPLPAGAGTERPVDPAWQPAQPTALTQHSFAL